MRTVIFIGLLMIASAIAGNPMWSDQLNTMLTIIFIASVTMDVVEFGKKISD